MTIKKERDNVDDSYGWTSVKYRLPAPNTNVLVILYDADLDFAYRRIAWLRSDGRWEWDGCDETSTKDKVTFWMPLPEMPPTVHLITHDPEETI